MSDFSRPQVEASLTISNQVTAVGPHDQWLVRVERVGSWRGSPRWSHWMTMAAMARLVRFVRRETRWEVVIERRGGGEVPSARIIRDSRASAIEAATELVADIAAGDAPPFGRAD